MVEPREYMLIYIGHNPENSIPGTKQLKTYIR